MHTSEEQPLGPSTLSLSFFLCFPPTARLCTARLSTALGPTDTTRWPVIFSGSNGDQVLVSHRLNKGREGREEEEEKKESAHVCIHE